MIDCVQIFAQIDQHSNGVLLLTNYCPALKTISTIHPTNVDEGKSVVLYELLQMHEV